jgi:hypothetical protein
VPYEITIQIQIQSSVKHKFDSIHYLYMFQQMHLLQHYTNLVSIIKTLKTLKNSYMFRSLTDHPQGDTWTLLNHLKSLYGNHGYAAAAA